MNDAVQGAAIALSASGERFAVALRTASGEVQAIDTDARRQSADAIALLDRLLTDAGLRPKDIVEVRVDRGPGSYTGLRMALSLARVLAAFGGARLRACTSLELLAFAAWQRHGVPRTCAIRPVLDARRARVHTARLELVAGRVRFVTQPTAMPLQDCQRALAGDEVLLLATTLGPEFSPAAGALPLPPIDASDLFQAALVCDEVVASDLEPLYLMGTYAE